jgi:hypothetical protein
VFCGKPAVRRSRQNTKKRNKKTSQEELND